MKNMNYSWNRTSYSNGLRTEELFREGRDDDSYYYNDFDDSMADVEILKMVENEEI